MNILKKIEAGIGRLSTHLGLGMQGKLIILFVVIKVIPLALLTIIAIRQFFYLGAELRLRVDELRTEAKAALTTMGGVAIEDSVKALNNSAILQLERTSTDLANRVAEFLYYRDDDIRYAAGLEPGEAAYRHFLRHKTGKIMKQREWVLTGDGSSWSAGEPVPQSPHSPSSNSENDTLYHNRPAELWEKEERPLYLEMTYIDLAGNEIVKAASSDLMDSRRRNVSNRLNTFAKAETYFDELKNLKPGEIYVSDVIGEYVGSRLIGMYTPENAAARGLEFSPGEEAYAGRENPNGKRFKGIVRWATPVVRGGQISGYVTLALDHDHIMEFVDHITPMEERYVEMPSAYEGNYAFIWDYKCRSIAHPRHHSIVGFNGETGEPQVPWLEESIYDAWQESALSYTEFIKGVPVFDAQSRQKRPAPELTAAGLVGLDGRYLNNAPQCTGWFDLTKEGGSGSFLILWSGIWKPNTAATIPYYTGNYGKTRRGFGFVALGAGLEDFQRPVHQTKDTLEEIITATDTSLGEALKETNAMLASNLMHTTLILGLAAGLMIVLVVFIAIWIASYFSGRITSLINGIYRFRTGERHFRFNAPVEDEMGTLANSIDEMADSLAEADRGPLVIINMELKVLFVNDILLGIMGKKLDQALGMPYPEFSLYPANTEYDPIMALHEGYESSVLYIDYLQRYFKGEASYLTDRQGNRIGYIITSTDVTEFQEQQKLLEEAVAEAKLANEHKGNFLARMSHEIRTPMNAIIGMTGIVKKKLTSQSYSIDDVMANISQIETSSHHLLGLLNDILDISKIEAGKIELAIEELDLLKLANTVVTIIQPRCDEKKIAFDIHFDIPDILYCGDSLRLRQVLINLLGNAVKFTPENGKVSFSIVCVERKDGKSLIDFSVGDTGIGISADAMSMLFRPFQQADNQIAQKYGGTGLGLAISKSIVNLFGGDIKVDSTEGKGSEFRFRLRLEETKTEKAEDVPIENIAGRLVGKKALLVDDVAINRMIAMSMLEGTGIKIDEAEDGSGAVKMFSESAENEYSIIYLDIQMPKMNGYDAAKAIRAMERADAKTVPIIALTANAFREDIEKAIASGMNAHLAKPMDMEKTIEETFRLLGIS
ncbi:MAG: response regulator [Treponema sp.]|jgi:signal transduction histidine kinase/HAMP domain-containing protein|nr:response regulator [Treponema sp.]